MHFTDAQQTRLHTAYSNESRRELSRISYPQESNLGDKRFIQKLVYSFTVDRDVHGYVRNKNVAQILQKSSMLSTC